MSSSKRIFGDLKIFARGYTRNKIGLFFSLVFPVILILLFGAIFSPQGNSSHPIWVYVQDRDGSSASALFVVAMNRTNTLRMIVVDNGTDFENYLLSHSAIAGILIPHGFGGNYSSRNPVNVTLYTNPADTASGIVIATTNVVVNQFNLYNNRPVIGVLSQSIRSHEVFKYIDFLVPGLIGFSILTSPMFSLVNVSSDYKRSRLFKQLSLTPLKKTEWLTSKIIWYMLLSVISFFLMTGTGILLFDSHVTITSLVAPFLLVGSLLFVSLGMLVGTVAKSTETAAVIGNLITFPMMFLSGTFFPVTQMPGYLADVAHVLPLYYVIDGLNQVMIWNNPGQMLYDMIILIASAAIIFALAVTFFKWRED